MSVRYEDISSRSADSGISAGSIVNKM